MRHKEHNLYQIEPSLLRCREQGRKGVRMLMMRAGLAWKRLLATKAKARGHNLARRRAFPKPVTANRLGRTARGPSRRPRDPKPPYNQARQLSLGLFLCCQSLTTATR